MWGGVGLVGILLEKGFGSDEDRAGIGAGGDGGCKGTMESKGASIGGM